MKRIYLVLLVFCCSFFSCKKEDANAIEIRVQNATPLQIERINITGGTDAEISFELLPAGFTTGYLSTGITKLFTPQCRVYVPGVQEPLILLDNNLTSLKPGYYTCQVSWQNENPTIKFTRE